MPLSRPAEFTVLATCIGGELAPQSVLLMQQSRRHRIRVVGVDASADAPGRHLVDEFHVVPRGDDPGYVEAVARIARQAKVDLVLPLSDEEAVALAGARGAIEEGSRRLACTDVETIRVMASKEKTYRWLAAHGFAVPEWTVVDDARDLEGRIDDILGRRGEVVVKPSEARGGRGAVVIRRDISGVQRLPGMREIHADPRSFRTELLADYAQHLPAIVMQRLAEPVHDVDLLGWQGKPLRVIPRRRLDSMRPNEGHTVLDSKLLDAIGRRLIQELRLNWLYDCDAMFDAAGTPYVVEINPRPSGSVGVSVTAGVPLFDDLVSLAKGEPVADVDVPFGRVVVPYRALQVRRHDA